MIKRTVKKPISFLLALFMIFSLTACNNTTTPEQEDTSDVEITAPTKEFTPSEEFLIVRGNMYSSEDTIIDACYYVKKAFEAAYGYKLTIETDMVEATAGSYEILIGHTNRKASQNLASTLYLNDYVYAIPSEKTIVICGGTPEATLEAAQKFCTDILTYNGKTAETKNASMRTNTKYTFDDTYQYSSVLINGILLEEYTLAISSPDDIYGAVGMIKELGQYTGQVMPIIWESEMTGEEESVIRIGAAYRDGKGSNKLLGYMINNYVDEKGNVLCIDASTDASYTEAVKDFFSKASKKDDGTTVEFTVKQETAYSVACYKRNGTQIDKNGNATNQNDYLHWELSDEKHTQLLDGLDYYEQTFYDDAGLPHRVYTLIVDTNRYTFDMGSANDGTAYTVSKNDKQTTQQHMQAAVSKGKKVVAGINADFFDIEDGYLLDDNHPFGMTIKEGFLISAGSLDCRPMVGNNETVRPFFGVDKDNNPIIAMETEYTDPAKRSTLYTACGGAYILCEEGKTNFLKFQYDIIHGGASGPTAVAGFREDGTVILMVVDGRQPEHSNGATLLQTSLLMHRFGASDAILFDGGGSSCMVLRDPVTNTYATANMPSGGQLRPIYNSLLVLEK